MLLTFTIIHYKFLFSFTCLTTSDKFALGVQCFPKRLYFFLFIMIAAYYLRINLLLFGLHYPQGPTLDKSSVIVLIRSSTSIFHVEQAGSVWSHQEVNRSCTRKLGSHRQWHVCLCKVHSCVYSHGAIVIIGCSERCYPHIDPLQTFVGYTRPLSAVLFLSSPRQLKFEAIVCEAWEATVVLFIR